MKKNEFFVYLVMFITLLLFTGVGVNAAGWEDYEVLKENFAIETNEPRDQWYIEVEYNSNDNEFMVIWRTTGPKIEECDSGDEDACTGNFHSMEARRISTGGEFIGETIQLISPDVGYKNGTRFAYNMYNNEYLIANPVSPSADSRASEILVGIMNSAGEIQDGLTSLLPGGGGESPLPEVVFNPSRREYLVVYSDRNIYNAYLNLIGFILDEQGNTLHGPFEVGNQEGDFYAPYATYNSKDDTYIVVWEDFRNVTDWLYPCDIYGALLDSDGNMLSEIPVIDDYDTGEPEAGDQRVPAIVYNPDKDEFFVVWEADEMPSVDDSAIFGRFLNPDGTFKGEPFMIVDEPRQQHWPEVKYIQEEKKYFMIWNDLRNDGLPAGTNWYESPAIDVYARWLDDTGKPIGDEILIAEREGSGESWKQVPRMNYSTKDKSFLIAWYNRYSAGSDTPFGGAPSDVYGTLYGIPSSTGNSGCPAVAIYGTAGEETKTLRRFRDTVLKDIPGGRKVIDTYYELGPEVVKIIEENKTAKIIVKKVVDGMLPFVKAASQ